MTVVWDCFPYWRERWAAEARLRLWAELAPGIDYRPVAFVGDRTHRGDPLPPDLPQPPDGVCREHVVLDAQGGARTPAGDWGRDEQQRDAVRRLLPEMAPDDLILLTDGDELVDPRALQSIVDATSRGPAKLVMAVYFWGARWRHAEGWPFPGACRARDLPERPTIGLRMRFDLPIVDGAGWHLTYNGSDADISAKLGAFAHAEFDTAEMRDQMREARARGENPYGGPLLDDPLTGLPAVILEEVTGWASR